VLCHRKLPRSGLLDNDQPAGLLPRCPSFANPACWNASLRPLTCVRPPLRVTGKSNKALLQGRITLDRYAHLSPEFVHAQRGIMDGMYTGGRTDGHLMDTIRKNRKDSDSRVIEKSGAPGEIRTPDPLVRSCQVEIHISFVWRRLRPECTPLFFFNCTRFCTQII